MNNMLRFEVKAEENKMKLREYVRGVAQFSGRLTKNLAMNQKILVNGKSQKLNYIVKTGDVIEAILTKEESQNIIPEKMDLNIVYEDVDVIVVNKEPNMVVHPTKNYPYGTLANGLLYYFQEKGENCIVRLVSRLDMDTSGLIMIAKNQFAHMSLARDMKKEDFEKSYLAIVHGNLKEKSGTIDGPIFRPTEDTVKRIVDPQGQESITHYQVVQSFEGADLVKLTLETGRTHQIRVHLSHMGHPIYGDSLYGMEETEGLINRQALHAYKLSFPHPRTGEKVSLEVELPEDMKELIRTIENK